MTSSKERKVGEEREKLKKQNEQESFDRVQFLQKGEQISHLAC